jgi:hypothetical protein
LEKIIDGTKRPRDTKKVRKRKVVTRMSIGRKGF